MSSKEALVNAGASLSVVDRDGKRPLIHCAAWHPDAKAKRACELLVEKRADVTVRDSRGQRGRCRGLASPEAPKRGRCR